MLKMDDFLKRNFRNKITPEILDEFKEIQERQKIFNCPHLRVFLNLETMMYECSNCELVKFSIGLKIIDNHGEM
jgi:hypothetical protein